MNKQFLETSETGLQYSNLYPYNADKAYTKQVFIKQLWQPGLARINAFKAALHKITFNHSLTAEETKNFDFYSSLIRQYYAPLVTYRVETAVTLNSLMKLGLITQAKGDEIMPNMLLSNQNEKTILCQPRLRA